MKGLRQVSTRLLICSAMVLLPKYIWLGAEINKSHPATSGFLGRFDMTGAVDADTAGLDPD